ncbi:phage holin family protein [Gephyromycinifex aptenodytis]|uniref:phage holin family protein n=1 Tax=Gephyromycinifex aptenodytis TaxID=2716227 RepID=UPI001445CF30|nr:phage holin family protein [Gephyromycinifex aptenodytis]
MSTSATGSGDRVHQDAYSAAYDEDMSLGERLGNITADMSTLIRQEIALAKAEATQSGKQAGKGIGMFAGAGVAALLVLIFFSLALAWWIGSAFEPLNLGWGALAVTVLWAIIAAVLAIVGKKQFKDIGMEQTVDSASRIPDAMKGNETA